ncbi:MAG: methyltransferase [Planctomycetota bacterium]
MTDARHAWLGYLILSFVLIPLLFVLRHRRSPFVVRIPPADRYGWIEAIYACTLIGYTAWLLVLPPAAPAHAIAGWMMFVAGALLVTCAVLAMGPSWRIGQDPDDTGVEQITSGLYGSIAHPIYAGMILVAAGVSLLDDRMPRSVLLLALTALYTLIQSAAENARWSGRAASYGPRPGR